MARSGGRPGVDITRLEGELALLSRYYSTTVQTRQGLRLDRSAYLVLGRLELDSAMSLKQIAEAFLLDVSTVNRQVGAMLKQGLVERVPDPDGGIARKIRATEFGLGQLRADRVQRHDDLARVVARWTRADVAQLGRMMRKFNESIEELGGIHWPRSPEH